MYKPIAVRLMVLGRDESGARPYVVVLTPPKARRKAEKFFERVDVKELLIIPGGGPSLAPNPVPVVVAAHTSGFLTCRVSDVQALCSLEWCRPPFTLSFCGLPITINSRRLTLGGIVRVQFPRDIGPRFYGLSAGHFGDGGDDTQSESEGEDDPESTGDIDANAEDDPMRSPPTVRPLLPPRIVPSTQSWDWSAAMTMGQIVEFDDAPDPAKPDLDWCLIEMKHLLPNLLASEGGDYRRADLVAPGRPSTSSLRSVVVISGTRGLQRGTLHSSPAARVLLGRSETFSRAYILRLDDGTSR